ncbi:cytochrome c biogenesis protein CcdA [Hyphomicrobium sp. D-2]|uniref:cytochrome c biogenesis CcdA family protein n=1 Tax=Hyphomicrobium sp. D-2 TaxID=3041621 RepID=UPI0024550410|nr:cytochrome c biogenesis protein CcdA [Hyphomicrobium sp. D-2]MDH4981433.1 cytochrome c biogenesis protein CcdA [Hyphomicrobium sp. D-2]
MFADLQIYIGVGLAGLVSFLSPCVLPLVPPYLSYLGGTTIDEFTAEGGVPKDVGRRVILAAILFVLGFTTVFVALGAGASLAGQLIQTYKRELEIAAGLVIILFGLHFLGVFRVNLLYAEKRYHHTQHHGVSYIGSYVIGLAFAFGWTPCIGPILATVLAVAANEGSLTTGVKLLFVYSLGLGIPFVLAAVALQPFLSFMTRFRRHLDKVEKAMGAFLVLTGILFLTGSINWFGSWMLEHFPALAQIEAWVTPDDLGSEIIQRGTRQP